MREKTGIVIYSINFFYIVIRFYFDIFLKLFGEEKIFKRRRFATESKAKNNLFWGRGPTETE